MLEKMRAKFFAIAALVLGMASCQKDFAPEANLGGEVDFTLAVTAPELSKTRAGVDGAVDNNNAMDSAFGAIDYLDGAVVGDDRVDWNDVDLRYSLEVYDADDLTAKPIKDRIVIIKDRYEAANFELRLIPNRNYRFVVFADFVAQGASKDADQTALGLRHDINGTLQNITIKEDALNDERADAYFKSFEYTPANNTHNRTEATLTRPYAKMRVVATDLAELNLNIDPASVEVAYTAKHPALFNAVTGEVEAFTEVETIYEYEYAEISKLDLSKHVYTANYDDKAKFGFDPIIGERRHSHMTLFTDYILANDAQQAISFKMSVKDGNGENIKITDFNTTIPIQRNHLTTIIGNVLTSGMDVKITIDDNFASEAETGASLERRLLETLINGGKFTLTEDLTLTAPHYLQGTVECAADAVIDLNGHNLKYVIPSDVAEDVANKYAIFVRVNENASLTFVGEGNVISDGYIASVNKGGVLNVSEGTFKTNSCTVFQSNGGEINIAGGVFEAEAYNGDHRYTINFVDSEKKEGLIEITGGSFLKYNPEESLSESPAMNFVAAGYTAIENGDYFEVVVARNIDLFADHAEVYSAEGLLQWAYIVNNGATDALKAVAGFDENNFDRKKYGLKLMANIKMPARAYAEENGTYVFTDEVITLTDNKPSASNWPIVIPYPTSAPYEYYSGVIDGNGKAIIGLRMVGSQTTFGFVGCMHRGGTIKNLTFRDARVNITSATYAGIVVGWNCDGGVVDGVKLENSSVYGTSVLGGIVGQNQRRKGSAKNYNEQMAYLQNCSADSNCLVYSTKGNVGGICGYNYGAIMYNCVTAADVTGNGNVGGVVGQHRDYWTSVDGYVLACETTADAVITNTKNDKSVGGIAGYHYADVNSHGNTSAWVVASVSKAQLTQGGAISGQFDGIAVISGSWAVKNGVSKLYGGGTSSKVESSFLYNNASEATQADVDAMNAAIDAYNAAAIEDVHPILTKRWVLTANGPVLQ